MGVKKLSTFVKDNIKLKTQKWTINQEEYKKFFPYGDKSNDTQKKENSNSGNKNGLRLIIDANAFFYYLGYKLNWFNFDIFQFLNFFQRYLHLLLAIENLELLIFVFDGLDTDKKMVTLLGRFEDRIKGIKEFYNRITTAEPSKCHYFVPKKIFPTPLVKIAYGQYLMDASKHYKKLKVNFSVLEADADIANLAIKHNAYVISKDSDFYIYNVPGYINLESIKFPKKNNKKLTISYTLYQNSSLLKILSIPRETLPLFATLCGNDYITFLLKYKKFINQLNIYECRHESTNDINNEFFKNISNFILDICENVEKRCGDNIDSKKKLNIYIEELLKMKEKENNKVLEAECQSQLIESIKEYSLTALHEDKTSQIKNEILKSYRNGKICETILNVLYNNQFKCIQFFEDVRKESCWNACSEERKETYKLLLKRNYSKSDKNNNNNDNKKADKDNNQNENNLNQANKTKKNNKNKPKDSKSNYIINELVRKDIKVIENPINISISLNEPLPIYIEDRFDLYLNVYKSNIKPIKKLPYYLIPVATCLRSFLITKIKSNSFVYQKEKDNGKSIYNNIVNNFSNNRNKKNKKLSPPSSDISNASTQLHDYEFEALLASCIAALTLTFLHKRVYNRYLNPKTANKKKYQSKKHNHDVHLIKSNIYSNNFIGCNNSYDNIKYHKNRSLFLKDHWCIQDVHNHKNEFENAVQIYAEFLSLLISNSNTMQVLNIGNDFSELLSLYSMYHYIWKEAYYSMLKKKDLFKYKNNNKEYYIFYVFKEIFKFNEEKVEDGNYFMFLEDNYDKIIKSILT